MNLITATEPSFGIFNKARQIRALDKATKKKLAEIEADPNLSDAEKAIQDSFYRAANSLGRADIQNKT
ncbi:MAG: hypothetical protein AB7P76_08635 [Candidatus Melainabacteria bacterium]